MGCEIKRVAANFNWPLSEVWKGFICPFSPRRCETCEGDGGSPAYKFMLAQWYGRVPFDPRSTGSKPFGPDHPIVLKLAERNVSSARNFYGDDDGAVGREARRLARDCFDNQWSHHLSPADVKALVKANRLYDFTHSWIKGKGWQPKKNAPLPTPQQVNEWSLMGLGHDGINQSVCVKDRCKREGLPYSCAVCDGDGLDPADSETQRKAEKWKSTEPPSGEWWQLWETVSEGSPISPAFATSVELVNYLVEVGDDWGQKRGEKWSRESAEAFVKVGWSPSLMTIGNKVIKSEDVAAEMANQPAQ